MATDERLATLESKISNARISEKPLLLEERNKLLLEVTLEKRGVIAAEFDAIHSVERAIEVGSLDAIIEANALRPAIIEALEKGLAVQSTP